jgi:hypothetical protein
MSHPGSKPFNGGVLGLCPSHVWGEKALEAVVGKVGQQRLVVAAVAVVVMVEGVPPRGILGAPEWGEKLSILRGGGSPGGLLW